METTRPGTTRRAPVVRLPAPPVAQRKPAAAAAPRIQTALRVSSPHDPAEREAEATARTVMRMVAPESAASRRAWESPHVARFAGTGLLRKAEGRPDVAANVAAEIQSSTTAGEPLPLSVRRFMEPRFRADFSGVRVHTDGRAAALSRDLNARAFTVGNQIFFGRDQFRPESEAGRELIAHELTHTVQQGSAVQRAADVTITQNSPPQVQRGVVSEALDYFAEKANNIPGFRMFTIILGVNPINMSRVERSGANILRALIEFIPGGGLITQALDRYGVFERAGAFVEQMVARLGMTGAAIKNAILAFIDSLHWTDAFHPGRVWDRAKRIFTDPIDRIISLARDIGTGILKIIKDAILRPLAGLAQGTRGYDLLKAVLGEDPITGDPYPRNADTLIGGFMKLIGQEEVWENLKKAKAVARAWAWFQNALGELMAFVRSIPHLFILAVTSLQLTDIIVLPRAWTKVAGVFFDVAGRFFSWAGRAVWNLLEIIFDVVSPTALRYIKRTGKALRSILRNPFPFVRNLVRAAKLGFTGFAAGFLGYLKAGLIDWLTGSLPGIYIPKAFTLAELVKFVFSVLGISWANVRLKLVKVVGEPVVHGLEKTFDFVVSLVRDGPAAAWEKIREQLGNLQDTVIGGITDFVVDTVVKKAVPKLIAMFVPGAGFISAILSIYDVIMVFVHKISKIAQVVTAFIGSIAAIAGGAVMAAAKRVEHVLAGLLSLAISFLAGFAGLGKVADKVLGVIGKVRATVDRAIDVLVAWIVTAAKKLFAALFGKKDEKGDDAKSKALKARIGAELQGKTIDSAEAEKALISSIYSRYSPEGLKFVRFEPSKSEFGALEVVVSASAAEKVAKLNLKTPEGVKELKQIAKQMNVFAGRTTIRVYYGADHKFFRSVTQARGKAGHAELRLREHFPTLLARIRRQEKTKKTPLPTPVPIHLDINRTPCDGCATSHLQSLLQESQSAFPDVPFTLTISSASVSQGAQITEEKGLIALLSKGVELTASTVWVEIKKQMVANGIKQIDYGTRSYDIDDVNEFIANASEVQALIDKAVTKLNNSKPTPASKP